MRSIYYLIQKEFRQIFREKANLGLLFVLPFIQLVVLGYAITLDVKNIDTAFLDNDNSVLSRNLLATIKNTKQFNLSEISLNKEKIIKDIDAGKIKLSVNLPNNFEQNLKLGLNPQLQIFVDGVDGNTAGISLDYITRLMLNAQTKMINPNNARVLKNNVSSIEIIPRMLYNPNLESKFNIVPGLIAIILTMITLLLTAINLVREKENGTLEQLMVTPITKTELILGKILPFVILGLIMVTIGILTAGLIFGIWLKGNLFLLYFFCCLYMFTTLGLGILISTIANTQQQAMFLSWFIIIFSIILSGFFIPIENMPPIIQTLTYLNPARYLIAVIRAIYLKDAGIFNLWQELVSMIVFGSTCITLAIIKFQKRIN